MRAFVPPPRRKHEKGAGGLVTWTRQRFLSTNLQTNEQNDVVVPCCPTEESPLLSSIISHTSVAKAKAISEVPVEERQGEITASGNLHNTWQHEAKAIASYSVPLVVTFLLQYSVNISSIIATGRVGKAELAAVSCRLVLCSYR